MACTDYELVVKVIKQKTIIVMGEGLLWVG